jgi:hypothetical protein
MRRVGRGIPASLAQGPSDNVGSTSFSFDALQALGERLAMKETQYFNTPPLHHSSCRITIVSGGQTGADRAALAWALKHNLPCGGWCPKGRKAEDGPIDSKYPLKETPSASYLQRTEWNVRDSDATVSFSIQPTLSGGSKRTMEFARKHNKTAPASLRGI